MKVSASANANGASGTLVDNGDGSYSFLAPATGAFAGEYLITITDPTSGWSEQLLVTVPLKVELSRSTLLARGERNSAVVTVTGAAAGVAINLAVAGEPVDWLPVADDTEMMAIDDSINANPAVGLVTAVVYDQSVTFEVVATASDYPEGRSAASMVLPAVAYTGSLYNPIGTPVQGLAELRIAVDGITSTLKDELDVAYEASTNPEGEFTLYGPADGGDYSLRFTADGYAAGSLPAAGCEATTPCLVVLDYEQTAAAPVLSPAGGSYTGQVDIHLASTTLNATLVYTLDGTTPSRTHGAAVENGSTLSLSESATLKVMAWKDGLNDSEVITANYTFTIDAPVASSGGGGAFGMLWLLLLLSTQVAYRIRVLWLEREQRRTGRFMNAS